MWEQLLTDVPNVALLFYVTLIAVELSLELLRSAHMYRLKDTLCSLATGGSYVVLQLLLKGTVLAVMLYLHQYAVLDTGDGWLTFLACYVAVDFIFYWYHRIVHEVRLGWAAHVVHHSSQQFNLGGTSLRQSFVEAIWEYWLYLPLALIFDPLMVLVAYEMNLVYMFWVHSRHIGKLHPAVEWLLSTPSHHRVHHACNVPYLDRNYGGTFIIWDRLFGTFAEEREAPVFGILHQLGHDNPVRALLDSWVALGRDLHAARGWRNRLGVLFMPPGWAPDGQGLTTRQIQAQAAREAADPQSAPAA